MNYKTLDCYNLLLDGCYQLRDESERCVCVPDLPSLWLQFVPEAEITWTDLNDSCDAVWTGAKKEESLQSFAGWFRCFSAEVEMMGVFSLRTHFWDLGLVRYSASSLCCGKCVFTGTLLCPCQRVQKNILYYQRCQQCCFQRLFWGGKWAVVSGWNWGETRSKINWNTYRSNKQATRHFKVALRCFFPPYFLTYTLTGHLLNFLLIQISHQPYTWKQLSALGHVDVVLVFHIQWACCHCIPCFLMYCSQRQGQKPSQIFRDPNSFFSSRNTCNFPSIFHTSCV